MKNCTKMIKNIWRFIVMWVFRPYLLVAALVGTCVMAYPLVLTLYNNQALAPMPVYLPNGFIYRHDTNTPSVTYHITNKRGYEVIRSNVKAIMWHEDWVYGYRVGHAKEVYYFICRYGEDCADHQSYQDIAFDQLLRWHGLPRFTHAQKKSYDELLKAQHKSGVDVGYGG